MKLPPPAVSPSLSTDAVLLARFAQGREGSREAETAFAEVLRRHTRLVYETARRMLGREDEAHDVTQKVFTLLFIQFSPGLIGNFVFKFSKL